MMRFIAAAVTLGTMLATQVGTSSGGDVLGGFQETSKPKVAQVPNKEPKSLLGAFKSHTDGTAEVRTEQEPELTYVDQTFDEDVTYVCGDRGYGITVNYQTTVTGKETLTFSDQSVNIVASAEFMYALYQENIYRDITGRVPNAQWVFIQVEMGLNHNAIRLEIGDARPTIARHGSSNQAHIPRQYVPYDPDYVGTVSSPYTGEPFTFTTLTQESETISRVSGPLSAPATLNMKVKSSGAVAYYRADWTCTATSNTTLGTI